MISLTKTFKFEAAHRLLDWPRDHQCYRPHGHSYVLHVTLLPVMQYLNPWAFTEGDETKPCAMIDFADISKVVKKEVVDVCDHRDLNEVCSLRNTTAEILLGWMYTVLKPHFPSTRLKLELWETTTGKVTLEE